MMFEDATGLSQKRDVGRETLSRIIRQDFANQAVDGLPAELVDFMLRTAVLDRLSGPLCEAEFLSMPALEVASPGIARSRRQWAGL
jgi:hypothetical protein